MSQHKYITIEGNIGAGKTSLAQKLATDFNSELLLEKFENNPFLPDFYKDPERNAFPLELFFMAERYQQLFNTIQSDLFKQSLITDFLFSKSLIFAQNNLSTMEFDLYYRLFQMIYKQLPKPDLIVYLHSSIPVLLNNIKERGRSYEQSIPAEYLEQIEKAYFSHFRAIKNDSRILIIRSDQLDFVNREIDYLHIQKLVSTPYEKGIHIL